MLGHVCGLVIRRYETPVFASSDMHDCMRRKFTSDVISAGPSKSSEIIIQFCSRLSGNKKTHNFYLQKYCHQKIENSILFQVMQIFKKKFQRFSIALTSPEFHHHETFYRIEVSHANNETKFHISSCFASAIYTFRNVR